MELLLRECASYVALAGELCSVLCIAVGMVETLVRTAGVVVGRGGDTRAARREVWSRFAPTWDDIGRLGAIALIRTALNSFLEKDMQKFDPAPEPMEEAKGRS